MTHFLSPPSRSFVLLLVGGQEEVSPVRRPPPEPLPRLRARVSGHISPCAVPLTADICLSTATVGQRARAPRAQDGRRGRVDGAGPASDRARPRSRRPRAQRWHGPRAPTRGGRPSMADRRGLGRARPPVAGCGSWTTCTARVLHGSMARARSPGAAVAASAACAARRTMRVATLCMRHSVYCLRVCTRLYALRTRCPRVSVE